MGQRLVFKCIKDDKQFATIYYQLSGYTQSIYYEAAATLEGKRQKKVLCNP